MELTHLHIKNFRCFERKAFDFTEPLVLVEGPNGSGKTSLLEAIHYACYVRSFRTYYPAQLVRFEQEAFFIKVGFAYAQERHELQIGFADKKRLVKLNQKPVASYKQVLDHYRVVTLTEDDLSLIKGAPEGRRRFLDQLLVLQGAEYLGLLKKLKNIVDNRNSLLKNGFKRGGINRTSYDVWTQQLSSCSDIIAALRKEALTQLEKDVNFLLHRYVDPELSIHFTYECKAFQEELFTAETRSGRSLFGAHLDDFAIQFQRKQSKLFASRGQQKLIIVLLKIAQVEQLRKVKGSAIILLDDFMTDFDENRTISLLSALQSLRSQLVFTSPVQESFFKDQLLDLGAQRLILTH
ncbi:DNA replication and repair protein RecF [Candidatus Dependentiae bacterium]|nr:DNA replication and repair protein RecF [Candidatus Dependentiae bacterium]